MSLNHNIFKNMDNLLSCYWAGFLAADGYIKKNNRSVRLCLQLKDKNHLEKFKMFIGKDNNIGLYKNSVYYDFSSKEICLDLKNIYNIINKKSLILQPPNLIQLESKLAFTCGYLDGDGCIGIEYNRFFVVSFRGTLDVLNWINNIFDLIEPKTSYKGKTKPNKGNQIHYCLKYKGYRAEKIIKLLKNSYSHLPLLERKWLKIDLLDTVPNRRGYAPQRCTRKKNTVRRSERVVNVFKP